jgi:hypothetical protein
MLTLLFIRVMPHLQVQKMKCWIFLNWFCDLDYPHKIFVAGNHDDCLYGEQIEGLPNDCHYLCHSGVEIEGVKFWGTPLFVGDFLKKGRIEQMTKQIPMIQMC